MLFRSGAARRERTTKSFQTNLIRPAGVKYSGRYGVRSERKGGWTEADFHGFRAMLRKPRMGNTWSEIEGCCVQGSGGGKKRQKFDLSMHDGALAVRLRAGAGFAVR